MEKIANFRERVSVTHVAMPRKDIWRALGAEFVATFLLMTVGVGVGMYFKDEEKPSLVATAITWGFLVATLAQAFGHVSGCHMNPAVTLALLVTRKIELVKSGLYIVTQCISAIVAVAFLKAILPSGMKGGWGVIGVHDYLSPLQGFFLEFIMTFVLLLLIFSTSDENRTDLQGSSPLAVGICITVLIVFGADWTGAGLNPARAFGPAVVEGKWDSQWIYWVGPIGGALVAAVLYENIFRSLRPDELEAAQIAKQLRAREDEEKESTIPPPV